MDGVVLFTISRFCLRLSGVECAHTMQKSTLIHKIKEERPDGAHLRATYRYSVFLEILRVRQISRTPIDRSD
jgi:hypothetical protein